MTNGTVVLFATINYRGVEKVRKEMAKDPVAGKKKCVHNFYEMLFFEWSHLND
jgi:hypothetical protein